VACGLTALTVFAEVLSPDGAIPVDRSLFEVAAAVLGLECLERSTPRLEAEDGSGDLDSDPERFFRDGGLGFSCSKSCQSNSASRFTASFSLFSLLFFVDDLVGRSG